MSVRTLRFISSSVLATSGATPSAVILPVKDDFPERITVPLAPVLSVTFARADAVSDSTMERLLLFPSADASDVPPVSDVYAASPARTISVRPSPAPVVVIVSALRKEPVPVSKIPTAEPFAELIFPCT